MAGSRRTVSFSPDVEEGGGLGRQQSASELELEDVRLTGAGGATLSKHGGAEKMSLRLRLLNQSGHTPSDAAKLESLDYTPIHNDFVEQALQDKYGGRKRLLGYTGRTFTRWVLTLVLGFSMGWVAFGIGQAVEHLGEVRLHWLNNRFDSGESALSTFLLLGGWNGSLALLACACVLLGSEEAVGSGIPEVKAFLNGVKIPKLFGVPCLIAKLVGTIAAVSSGFCVGPEGPLVHMGATMGMQLTRLEHLFPCVSGSGGEEHGSNGEGGGGEGGGGNGGGNGSSGNGSSGNGSSGGGGVNSGCFGRVWRYLRIRLSYFRSDIERRDFVSIGAATGFAAAFGAPVGGILFSLEEVSSFWSTKLMWRTLTATSLATITLSVLSTSLGGASGGLSNFGLISLDIAVSADQKNLGLQMLFFALIGCAGGLVGAGVNATWGMLLRRGWLRPPTPRRQHWRAHVRVVLLLSLFTTAVQFWAPLALPGACVNNSTLQVGGHSADDLPKEVEIAASGTHFGCNATQTNEVAFMFFENRETVIKALLEQGIPPRQDADKNPELTNPALCAGFFGFLGLMVLAFGTAIPSGIFMPTIFAGCCGGSLMGRAMSHWFAVGDQAPHLGVFALIGAVALLGGIQRSSVSLVVIILEGTGEVQFVLPIIVTTVCARWIGDHFNHGVYEMVLESKNLPFLEAKPDRKFVGKDVSSIMTCANASEGVRTISLRPTLRETLELLEGCEHCGFPVVHSETGELCGLVLRDQLRSMMVLLFASQGEHGQQRASFDSEVGASDRGDGGSWREDSRSLSQVAADPEVEGAPADAANEDVYEEEDPHSSLLQQNLQQNLLSPSDGSQRTNSEGGGHGGGGGGGGGGGAGHRGGSSQLSSSSSKSKRSSSKSRRSSRIDVLPHFLKPGSVAMGSLSPAGGSSMPNWFIQDAQIPRRTVSTNFEQYVHAGDLYSSNSGGLRGSALGWWSRRGRGGRHVAASFAPTLLDEPLDVGAMMTRGVHVIMYNAPLAQAHAMFCSLGLRHLIVLDFNGRVAGIVTRKDLLAAQHAAEK